MVFDTVTVIGLSLYITMLVISILRYLVKKYLLKEFKNFINFVTYTKHTK